MRLIIFILLLIGNISFAQDTNNTVSVSTTFVEETTVFSTALYGARVEPITVTEVPVPFAGTILNIFVQEGSRVSANAPLYSIERTVQGSIQYYEPLIVRALSSGIVSDITIRANEEVRDGRISMNIADISSLKAVLSVSDKDIRTIKLGQECTIQNIDATNATISKINVLPNSETGLFSVEVAFGNNYDVFAGMFVTIEIPINPVEGTFIPSEAIVSRYGKKFVWVITEDNKADMRDIEVINIREDFTLVGGLQGRVQIALTNTRLLTQDMIVEPTARSNERPR